MNKTNFRLDSRIEETSHYLAHYQHIQIRLADDERFFWLLLIPEDGDIIEWHDMDANTSKVMEKLIRHLGKNLQDTEKPDKINIGALGNIVPQFHLHLVLRYQNDAAWPGPIWGFGTALLLSKDVFETRKNRVNQLLQQLN